MRRVVGELDAVVKSIEAATSALLDSIEDIETQPTCCIRRGCRRTRKRMSTASSNALSLLKGCNFQDLTGQRMSRIVGVLHCVDEHLDRVSEAWSRLDSFHALVEAETETETDKAVSDDRALLNRPKLAEDEGRVDQFDIHALLG